MQVNYFMVLLCVYLRMTSCIIIIVRYLQVHQIFYMIIGVYNHTVLRVA